MGKSYTPSHRLEFKCVSGKHYTSQAWRHKDCGRPNLQNLDMWVTSFEESLLPGGANKHLGADQVIEAKIIRQSTGAVEAHWKRSEHRKDQPMFEVLPKFKEEFQHDDCPRCARDGVMSKSVPLEGVKDQSLRGCPVCDHEWFENLAKPVSKGVQE